MNFGHFDDERREYVITRPDTPLPWINYLGSESYFGLISNTAGGYSFFQDARLRRINRYRYNHAPLDTGGRMLYLRHDGERKPSEPLYWSPTGQPVRIPLDEYECRHGLGYTRILSRVGPIAAGVRFFIPLGQSLEVWQLTVENLSDAATRLSVFAGVEFCLWDALDDLTNFQRNLSTGEVEVDRSVIYHKTEYRERRNHFAYFACSRDVTGFDTQREAFLGPYRGWEAPLGVELGKASNSIAHGWQPIGLHHVQLALEPRAQTEVVFLLGYHENPVDDKFDPPGSQSLNKKTLQPILERFLDTDHVEAAFDDLQEYWGSVLSRFQVTTPDPHTNRTVNVWNAYQVMATFNLSRSASSFESGIGRGIGFRDSNQDLLGFVHLIPQRARERLLDLASTQLPNGGAYHQYQPLTKRGNHDIGSGFHDDPLWLILACAAYLKETGDRRVLDERVPYDNQPGTETLLYEHLQRALRFALERLGPHGLPLIGRADWNDCLNLNCYSVAPGESFQTTVNKDGKVAESVFLAGLFVLAAREMCDIARYHHRPEDVEAFDRGIQAMEHAVARDGWDGAWFRRAYDDAGRAVGSASCDEGQIYIEPQGMCVMAGLGIDDGRARTALDSVAARLATPHGIVLHQPAYTRYDPALGEISSYPPGYKENAGVFCHTNPWIMIAETRIGRGDAAFDYYRRINPSVREAISEVHRCEPYVYAQMIAGRDAPTHGEAKNSWLTGTAAWAYVAMTHWILGIRPTLDGLQVAPVMPSSWDGFDAVRWYRGVRYVIHVERIGPGNQVLLEADGHPLADTVVPIPPQGTDRIHVLARIGRAP